MNREKLIALLQDESKDDWHVQFLILEDFLGESQTMCFSGPLGDKKGFTLAES